MLMNLDDSTIMQTMNPNPATHQNGMARFRIFSVTTVAIIATVFPGCSMMNDPAPDTLPPDGVALPILRQWTKPHCHENRPLRLTIRNERGLSQIPLEDFDVNFDEEMLLIVTLGRTYSDQYQIRFGELRRDGGELVPEVIVIEPPASSALTVACPYGVAVVPRCDLKVRGFSNRPPKRIRSWSQSGY